MDDRLYSFLKATAIILAVSWLGWSIYDHFRETDPGNMAYHAANKLFEDDAYQRALEQYDEALRLDPDHIFSLRGRGRSLMQLGRHQEALRVYVRAIEMEPEFAATYANRGILYDRMGRYEEAIADYDQALELDASIAEGPHWLTRFLRLQPEKPPSVAERARYLREQLAKPASERLLRVPELDQGQRPYKQ